MYIEKMDVHRENGCTSRKWMYICKPKEMYMHTAKLVFTVIMAMIFMGCPPPVSDNSNNSASGGNAPPQSGANPDNSASESNAPPQSGANPDNSASGSNNPDNPALVRKHHVAQVSSGDYHTMILKTDDSLWAVGLNETGQLGNGDSGRDGNTNLGTKELIPIPVMLKVKQAAASNTHTIILKKNGELWAIGSNKYGQLGDGTHNNGRVIPVKVKEKNPGGDGTRAMTEVDQISTGDNRTMIVKTTGTLWAVGNNSFGQLGDGSYTNRLIPVEVKEKNLGGGEAQPITNVAKVSSGSDHNMILKNDDTLWAVGPNDFGQLGDGSNITRLTAVQVMISAGNPMGNVVAQVSAGGFYTIILKNDDTVWAVGRNNSGQLGDNTTDDKLFPVQVMTSTGAPMNNVAQISAGFEHSMILKKNGELWAFGLNDTGQLGDGTTTNRKTPVQVMEKPPGGGAPRAMTEVAQVSAGREHTMIVKTNGTLWTVGANGNGQLGNGGDDNLATRFNPEQITPVAGCHDYLTEE